ILKPHQLVALFGAVERRPRGGPQITNPQYELIDAEEEGVKTVHTGRIVPIYEKVGSVTPKMQRRLVYDALGQLPQDIPDPLPEDVRSQLSLPDRRTAFHQAHFPDGGTSLDLLNRFRQPAQVRL